MNQLIYDIIPTADFPVLTYCDDDGTLVEPEWYAPIIPLSLCNGSQGIGTGFSHRGLSYNPLDLSAYLKKRLQNPAEEIGDILPYYEGFTGEILKIEPTKYLIKGKYEIVNSKTIRITELPVGTWTTPYKNDLEYMMADKDRKGKKKTPIIKKFRDLCTDALVEFEVTFDEKKLTSMMNKYTEHGCSVLEKKLKLYTTVTTTNMHMFNSKQQLRKFNNVGEIIDEYFPVRYAVYQRRKEYMLNMMEKQITLLSNKVRFISEQCDDVIDLRRKKKQQVIELLKSRGYDVIDGDENYKYLREMRMEDVEEENMEKLKKKLDDLKTEYELLKITTIEEIWTDELNKFEINYQIYLKQRRDRLLGNTRVVKKKKSKKKIATKVIKR